MKAPNSTEHLKSLNELNSSLQEKRQLLMKTQKEANQLRTKHHLNSQIEKVSTIFDQLNVSVSKKVQPAGKSDGSVSGDKEDEYQQQLQASYQEMLTYIKSMQTEFHGKITHAKHLAEMESKIKQLDSEIKTMTEKKQHKAKSHNEEVQKYQLYMQEHHEETAKQRKRDHFEYLMIEKKKQIEKLNSKPSSFDEQTRAANNLKTTLPKMKKCTFDLKFLEYFFVLDINPPRKPNEIPQLIEKIDAKLAEIQKSKDEQEKNQKEQYGAKIKGILEGHDTLESYREFKLKELELDEKIEE